jgi:ppGpp synthetase/RelA/SpoT-type nucleotidyltranferase
MALLNGITKGRSHKEGGIPMTVRSTGQQIEMEGGEIVINKRNSADSTKYEFEGKQLTTCEISSILNSKNNNGVKIDCDNIVGKKYEYKEGGMIENKTNIIYETNSQLKNKLKDDFNINFKVKNIFYPKQSLGLKRNEMPQIRSQFLPILFEQLENDRIRYKDITVVANTLKPSQNEINIDTVNQFSKDTPYLKRVLVSSDNYIIDGHHRWYFSLLNDLPVDITKIDLPIEEALNYIRQLDFIEIDQIAKGGMINDSQKTLFDGGGNIQVSTYSKEIPLSIYEGVINDYDNDGIANADDLEPNKKSDVQLEEISLKDELTDIVKYRNLFVGVQKEVLNKIGKINTCGKIECNIKTRIKTPYSIINKLRRRSLTDVKTLDKLDKKANEFLKNKTLKGIDLYKGLTDILGFMVIVEDFESLSKLKNEVEQGNLGEVLEFEDFYANDNNGYRAYHFLLSTELKGTFIPYELQIRTARVNKLAGITHTIYKQGKLNGVLNDKLAKQIELADKGNTVIARLVDAELLDKNLSNKLTLQKFALGNVVMGAYLYQYKYKVRNNNNKQITFITEFAENESVARKQINKKYKDFTILSISVNDKDFVSIDEFIDNPVNKNQLDLFDTHNTQYRQGKDLGEFKVRKNIKKGSSSDITKTITDKIGAGKSQSKNFYIPKVKK